MKFEITGRHIEVTEALKAHVQELLDRIENAFNGKSTSAHVIIEVERGRHRSEIIVNWMNETLTADSRNADMYQSLTQTVNKIEKQARKLKDKVIDKSHRAKKAAVVVSTPADSAEKIARSPRIIQTNGADGKPMTPEEAVLELENSARQFVVFRNADSAGSVAVLFKRHDGDYGLVQP
jgi:putative sigma-54 modulation protein